MATLAAHGRASLDQRCGVWSVGLAARRIVITTLYGEDMTAGSPDALVALAQRQMIGISTGVFERLRGCWEDLVAAACGVSSYAVELSALSEEELPGLVSYLTAKARLPFSYVSVHGPVKNRALDDAQARIS